MRRRLRDTRRRGNACVSRRSLLCLSIALIVSSARLVSCQRWPVAQDANLRRVTVSNDDGDVYVESAGDGSEIVLKSQKVRVDGDVYCYDGDVGISQRVDGLSNRIDGLSVSEQVSRIDALNTTQYELRGNDTAIGVRLDALESAKTALEQVDVDVRALIGAPNATAATMRATNDGLATRIVALNATDTALKTKDTELSGRVDALNTTDAELTTRLDALDTSDAELKTKNTALSGRADALNATDSELRTADVLLASRIDALNMTDATLKYVDDGLTAHINALNVTCVELKTNHTKLSDRIDTLNTAAYGMQAQLANLNTSLHKLMPIVCDKLTSSGPWFDGDSWYCECRGAYFGPQCTRKLEEYTTWSEIYSDSTGVAGIAVAMEGNVGVVGAPAAGPSAGSAYVLQVVGETWRFVQKVGYTGRCSTYDANSKFFGASVDISNGTIVVADSRSHRYGSGPGSSSGCNEMGRVHIYTRSSGMWTIQTSLTDGYSGWSNSRCFGQSVSIYENSLIVGTCPAQQIVYFFERSGSDWQLITSFTPDGDLHSFGYSVRIHGDLAVASDPGSLGLRGYSMNGFHGSVSDAIPTAPGAGVFVYARAPGTTAWYNHSAVRSPVAYSAFGWVVCLHENILVVGDPRNSALGRDAGAVYIYLITNQSTVLLQTVYASDAESDALFGFSCSMNVTHLIIGAPGGSGITASTGKAYILSLDQTSNTWSEVSKLVASSTYRGNFGRSVDFDGSRAMIGEPSASETYMFNL